MQDNIFKKNESKIDKGRIINIVLIVTIIIGLIALRDTIGNFFVSTQEIWTRYTSYFITGLINTIALSFISVLFGTIIGAILYAMTRSSAGVVMGLGKACIEVLRGTPLLLQLSIAYIGFGSMIDFRSIGLPIARFAFVVGAITVSINSGAYVAEIIRSGIQSIPKGQIEAGRSLGMSGPMTMKEIVVPQAVRNIFPALINEFIAIIKETSIVSTFGVTEIMYNVNLVRGASFRAFEPLIISGILYFAITFTLTRVVGVIERRMNLA